MNLEAAVDEALNAAVDLIEIASHETELLFFMRPREIAPLMERKQSIAGFYTDIIKKLERRRVSFASLPDRRKEEVQEVSDWVKLVLGENARILRAAFEANEKLLLAIKQAAEDHYGPGVLMYSDAGTMSGKGKMDSAVKVSLGLNEMG